MQTLILLNFNQFSMFFVCVYKKNSTLQCVEISFFFQLIMLSFQIFSMEIDILKISVVFLPAYIEI